MSVEYINPDGLNKNPAFSNVIMVSGNAKTVYVGGQDALDAPGRSSARATSRRRSNRC